MDNSTAGLDRESVINCDGLHTVAQSMLTRKVGSVDDATLGRVCDALNYVSRPLSLGPIRCAGSWA